MSERRRGPESVARLTAARRLIWCVAFAVLGAWVANRLGAFDLSATIVRADGEPVSLPNTFATVDHPFHAARAEILRRSLADGEMLRWIGSHQGGYPVEFYPLGAAALEVALWALLLGTLPMLAIHKVAVILVFLAPLLGFYLLAREERAPIGVAFLALSIHVAVRGWWWSGGSMELIEWGLLTNVAAMTIMPAALALAARFTTTGDLRAAALFIVASSFAVYTNTRSTITLAVIAIGVLVWSQTLSARDRLRRRVVIGRLGLLAAGSLAVSAPQIISLIRFGDLYYFVRYETYESAGEFLDASVQAVSSPVFAVFLAGLVIALFAGRRFPTARLVAIVLVLYVGLTLAVSLTEGTSLAIEQLEPTRLMPFQRLLMIYLAAFGIYAVLRRTVRSQQVIDGALGLLGVAVLVAYVVAPVRFVPESDRGLVSVPTTGVSAFDDLERAVRLADEAAESGTAILVLGSVISWHDQLWAPVWSDRLFFYDDWLWYWQTDHWGDYDPTVEHAYPNDASALEPAFFERHAIGAVAVTGDAREAAMLASHLQPIRQGTYYDVYEVIDPVTVVTATGQNATGIDIGQARIAASIEGGTDPQPVTVRHNWFPRWSATINGQQAGVEKLDDGYMEIPNVDPNESVVLTYTVDGWDWLGRLLALMGGSTTLLMLVAPRWTASVAGSIRRRSLA